MAILLAVCHCCGLNHITYSVICIVIILCIENIFYREHSLSSYLVLLGCDSVLSQQLVQSVLLNMTCCKPFSFTSFKSLTSKINSMIRRQPCPLLLEFGNVEVIQTICTLSLFKICISYIYILTVL